MTLIISLLAFCLYCKESIYHGSCDKWQARQALRALRAVVRLQAIFRGRQVRKQAVVTLRCMQALVRVQARVRARSARMSPEGQAVQKLLDEHRYQTDPVKQAEVLLQNSCVYILLC